METMSISISITEARAYVRRCDEQTLVTDIKWMFNCVEASIDEAGDIWIADPQTGHWLSDDKIIEFVEWAKNR